MNLSDLLEDSNKDLVIIYPGRFHPFHIGHGKVYKYLKQKYSNAKVFISTSGKVDGDRSPFTFEEKRKMMILAGVSASDIVQTKSPYQSIEIMERFDKDKTVVVFAVSEKDMAEDPRFDFSNGLKLKKNGEPAYLQKWNGLENSETFGTRGYIATTPTFKFKVLGQEINSASQIRNMIAKSDDTKLTQMLQDLYNITDVPQDIIDLFKSKVGNKETMNENWDEHSFSEYLKENVIEDNIMKDSILQTLTEGKSPHKKGTKKYKAHMAAMHAESFDEEFDAKVEQVVESKLKNVAADIKDYVDDHKEHFDAYPMDVEVNGKVYDFDDYWKILDLVYPDSYDNKKAIAGMFGEGEYHNEQHEKLEYIHHVIQETDEDGHNDELMIQQALEYIEDIKVRDDEDKKKLSYVSMALSSSVDEDRYFDQQMADQALAYVEDIREQHFNADGSTKSESVNESSDHDIKLLKAVARQMASDAQKGDYTAIDELLQDVSEEEMKSFLSDHRSPDEVEYFQRVNEVGRKKFQKMPTEKQAEEKRLARLKNQLERMKKSDDTLGAEFTQKLIDQSKKNLANMSESEVTEAGGYYTQPVYDMIEKHGYEKVMHELLTKLHADVIQDFISRVDLDESVNEAPDHEVSMARKDVQRLAKYSSELEQMLSNVSEEEGLQGWVQAKITKAADYISSVKHYMEGDTSQEVNEADIVGDNYANVYYDYSESFYMIDVYKDGKKVAEYDDYIGANEEGDPIKDKFLELVKKAGLEPEGLNLISTGGDEPDEYGVFKNGKFNWDKNVNEQVRHSPEQGFGGQERNFIHDLSMMYDGVKRDPAGLRYLGTSEMWDEGNILKDKGKLTTLMLWVKKNKDVVEKRFSRMFGTYSNKDENGKVTASDGNQILLNIIKKIGTVNENWKDVTPAGYGPDDYDEKDVAPEDHGGDLKKMQDTYKYNEDRNNHSENILMLAQAFGDRGEIKAVEGLLKIIKRQGYTTPEQSEMMYKAIHKKYYKKLFPETETEGNKFSGELEKAKIDGKKTFDVDGKTYKVKKH